MLHKSPTDGLEHPRCKGFEESLVSGLCLNSASRCSHLGLFQTPCTWYPPQAPRFYWFQVCDGHLSSRAPTSFLRAAEFRSHLASLGHGSGYGERLVGANINCCTYRSHSHLSRHHRLMERLLKAL